MGANTIRELPSPDSGPTDYLRLYDLESYVFTDVHNRFHADRSLGAFDVFCIVIWKANRAKSKMAARLMERGHHTIEAACWALTSEIAKAGNDEARFMVLRVTGGSDSPWHQRCSPCSTRMRSPYTTTGPATRIGGFHYIADRAKPESVWNGYTEFMDAVKKAAPPHLSLRDKDRYLWARAFADQLETDIEECFGIPTNTSS